MGSDNVTLLNEAVGFNLDVFIKVVADDLGYNS